MVVNGYLASLCFSCLSYICEVCGSVVGLDNEETKGKWQREGKVLYCLSWKPQHLKFQNSELKIKALTLILLHVHRLL